MCSADLVKQGDVERESKWIFQSDLLRELGAQFPGSGRRVSQEGLRVAIHEGDGEHEWLL